MSFVEGLNAVTNRKLLRQQIAQEKELHELKLAEAGYTRNSNGGFDVVPNGQADLNSRGRDLQIKQLGIVQQGLNELQSDYLRQKTDNAIEDFVTSGDASVFQQTLNNNPKLKFAWQQRGVQAIANLDFTADQDLFVKAGLSSKYLDDPNYQKALSKVYYKVFDGNNWSIASVNQLVAETGAQNRLKKQSGKVLLQAVSDANAALEGRLTLPNDRDIQLKEDKLQFSKDKEQRSHELATKKFEADNQIKEDNLQLSKDKEQNRLEIDTQKVEIEAQKADTAEKNIPTKEQKNLAFANEIVQELLDTLNFKSSEDFFKSNLTEEQAKEVAPLAHKIEMVTTGLSNQNQKKLKNINKLFTYANIATELTPEQTGLWDNLFSSFKTYFNKNYTGNRERAALTSVNNILRHELFGTALSKNEINFSTASLGTLNQQLPALLSAFKNNVEAIQSEVKAMKNFGNPHAMHIRLSPIDAKLDAVIEKLDYNIELHKNKEKNNNSDLSLSPEDTKVLDQIWKEAQTGNEN